MLEIRGAIASLAPHRLHLVTPLSPETVFRNRFYSLYVSANNSMALASWL